MADDVRARRGGLWVRPLRGAQGRWLVSMVGLLLLAGIVVGIDADAAVSERPDRTWGANGRVLAIVTAGGRIYIGGTFTLAVSPTGTTVARTNLMALDATTGELDLTFKPQPDGEVDALAVSPDGTRIYVGGVFNKIGGVTRRNLAAVDAVTGANVATWSPEPNRKVRSLSVGNGRVYVGGGFTSITDKSGTAPQGYLASVSVSDGVVDRAWNPLLGSATPPVGEEPIDPIVRASVLSVDGRTLYFGGEFVYVDGVTRTRMAAVDALTGNLNTAFVPKGMPTVMALAADTTRVYVALAGGGGEARALDAVTGLQRWYVHGNGNFQGIDVVGNLVYIGGHYGGTGAFGGLVRYKLAAVAADTGAIDAFAPRVNSPLGVFPVKASGNRLYVGGDFTTVSGLTQPHFAQLTG